MEYDVTIEWITKQLGVEDMMDTGKMGHDKGGQGADMMTSRIDFRRRL